MSSTPVSLSELAFALMIADGQLDNAIAEERRWRLRRQDAVQAELDAHDQVIKWSKRVEDLKRNIGQ